MLALALTPWGRVVVPRHRIAVGQERERGARVRVHEAELEGRAPVSERARRPDPRRQDTRPPRRRPCRRGRCWRAPAGRRRSARRTGGCDTRMRIASSTVAGSQSPEWYSAWKSMATSAAVATMEWLGSPPASTCGFARYHAPQGSTSWSSLVRSVATGTASTSSNWSSGSGSTMPRPSGSTISCAEVFGEREAGLAFHELGDHPRGAGEVELQPAARLPVEAPLRHRLEARLAVEHLRIAQRREREAGAVREHLLDRHDLLPVGRELGDDVADTLADVEHAVVDQLPHRRRDDGAPDRLQDVLAVVGRVAVGLERDESAVAARRRPARSARCPAPPRAAPGGGRAPAAPGRPRPPRETPAPGSSVAWARRITPSNAETSRRVRRSGRRPTPARPSRP